ncbi:hypothetical protein GCM10011415_33720 [Salipiger pallidus]|uniref:Uncharacterized protein n=1 Tax=Salipiger pallidus TaxID=1775170 RepID=A0A8J2ZM92_9RHOB|nr:hypothetical protein [Salipiger pallidus]GGG81419.1 hypothetical protein GCM10011415_33720 [Salipiger pallidus]
MTQTTSAAEALAILDEAYAYYQPEPVLVHQAAEAVSEDDDAGFTYYEAA